MKISNTLNVTIKDPDGDARFSFKEIQLNDFLERQVRLDEIRERTSNGEGAAAIEATRDLFSTLLEDLVKVEGLENEDGKPITVEQIKDLELPLRYVNAITLGYAAAVKELAGVGSGNAEGDA